MAEMGRRLGRSGERSNFAVTCSLLSQYIKEKGSIADLGLGLASRHEQPTKVKEERYRTPTTMSLLPGVEVLGVGKGETKEGGVSPGKAMELFPQPKASDVSNQEKGPLTIFYGGKVLVFDNFPAEKANDLMQLASKGISTTQNFAYVPAPAAAAVVDFKNASSVQGSTPVPAPASPLLGDQVHTQKPGQPNISDMPIARKASLHRFLEKRKDRLNAKAPYQVSASPATAASTKPEENQSWLGLGGPQPLKPSLSLNSECNQ
ncbi:protein TIFY 10a-like [Typha angustifolia]|uniref:protein TIFY 10a-like n=1 Tax=Typha angustifolia TaxID=59011 RepID=UPI003C2EB9FD